MTHAPRLCMVVHGDYPADPRVARETRAAVGAGFEVDVVATREESEAATERYEGVTVHRLPISRRRHTGRLRFFGEYVVFAGLAALRVARLMLRSRPDLIQVHSPPDFLIVAALLPKIMGARVVLDVHDLSPDMFSMRFGESRGARAAQRALLLLERLACRVADVVVTVHDPYRDELARRGVDRDGILVVLNSLDESRLPPEPQAPARSPFRIVYHGTVTPHYGLSIVMKAFALLPDRLGDARLEIIGGGDAVAGLVAQAEALGVADRVELTGVPLPHQDTLARIAGATVGVIPNLPSRLNRFALSTKLFEYVVLGIPVVVSDLPTLRSHFSDEEVAFFRAGDPEALASTLVDVADDYDAALARAAAARNRYRASYQWERQAGGYTRMLDLLAAGRPWTASSDPAEDTHA